MNIEFDVETHVDKDFVAQINRVTARALELTAGEVWAGIRKHAPVDHGRLAGSFQMRNGGDELTKIIYTNVSYALAVHNGTGIYGESGQPIQPTTAGALKFFWKKTGRMMIFKGDLQTPQQKAMFGQWAESQGMTPVFAWVQGMKGRPYTEPAIKEADSRLNEFVRRAINETK